MVSEFLNGIWLGLASGWLCVGCWAVLLPIIASSAEGKLRPGVRAFAQFTLGRLVAYIAFGALIGYLGTLITDVRWVLSAGSAAYILLSGILLVQAVRSGKSRLCTRLETFAAKSHLPFWVGMALGVFVCPPFLINTVRVLRYGSTMTGMAAFAGFFLGTTVFLAPSVFLGLAGRAQFVRNLGRAACIFAALFFLYQGLAGLVGEPQTTAVEVTQSDLKALLPDADRFSEKVEPSNAPPYWEALDAKGGQIAVVYLSCDERLCPEIRGFGGHVPLLAAVRSGKLVAIKLLPGWETPSYVTRIYSGQYKSQFKDKAADDPFTPGRDIDAITGATVTNKAICEEVRAILATTVGRGPGEGAGVPASAIILAATFAAAAAAFMLRLRWLRYALLAGSAGYFGFYMRGFLFSSADVVKLIFFGKSALSAGWAVLVGGIVVTSLVFGRLFCGYICPFGALHEFCGRLTARRFQFSGRFAARLKYVKYVVLFAAPALFLATGRVSDAAVEPFGTLFSLGGSVLQWMFLVFVIAAGFFVMRFFCRFLCPAGAAMAILSLARGVRDRRRTDCRECGKCLQTCPMDALTVAESILDADYTECIDCNDCKKVQQNGPCSKVSNAGSLRPS